MAKLSQNVERFAKIGNAKRSNLLLIPATLWKARFCLSSGNKQVREKYFEAFMNVLRERRRRFLLSHSVSSARFKWLLPFVKPAQIFRFHGFCLTNVFIWQQGSNRFEEIDKVLELMFEAWDLHQIQRQIVLEEERQHWFFIWPLGWLFSSADRIDLIAAISHFRWNKEQNHSTLGWNTTSCLEQILLWGGLRLCTLTVSNIHVVICCELQSSNKAKKIQYLGVGTTSKEIIESTISFFL